MIELTEEEFQGDLDKYTLRIQNGEDFLIKNSKTLVTYRSLL